MKNQMKIAAVLATTIAIATPAGAIDNPNGCKVVERKSTSDNSGQLSSSVTVGGGRVSAQTGGAGNSVTVHSGDGKTSSAATVGSSGGSSTVVASGTGDCTIYVNPGEKDK